MQLIKSLKQAILGTKNLFRARQVSLRSCQKNRRLSAESLEARNLMAGVVFDSLSGIGNGDNLSSAFAVDADQVGNSYVTGRFSGTVDFETNLQFPDASDTLTAKGAFDIFVAKYAPSGALSWVVQMGGADPVNGSDWGRDIKVAPGGDIFVGGEFQGSATFGSQTLVSSGGSDAFLAKLNASGVVQWARKWGAASGDQFLGLDLDNSGNAVASSNRTNESLTINKFSSAGSSLWTKEIATNPKSAMYGDITTDAVGNVFVAANYSGNVDFDPSNKTKYVSAGSTSSGLGSGVVFSLNASGNFRWVSPFQTRTDSSGYRGQAFPQTLEVDNQGNLLVGGFRNGVIDFQASSATFEFPSTSGGFLVSLTNTNGYLNWGKTFDAVNGTAYVEDIDVDPTGGIYLAGSFSGTVDFDPGAAMLSRAPAGGTSTDAFYSKLGSTGNLLWAETFGGTNSSDIARGIAVDGNGAVHVAGGIGSGGGAVDFDPDPLVSKVLSTNLASKGFRLRVRQV